MAAFIRWGEERRLGIDSIDRQHQTLAACINRLAEACGQAPAAPSEEDRQRLSRLVDELYETTRSHFSQEEALMRDEHYPAYAAHAREHVMLLAELKTTIASVKADCSRLNTDILDSLKSWLIAHVSHSDRAFASFLQEKHRAPSAAT